MPFEPQTYQDPSVYLADLEQRIKAAVPRAARAAVPALGVNAVADVTVTWPEPFDDANYTVTYAVEENISTGTTGPIVRQIRSRSAAGCVIRVSSAAQAYTAGQITLHVIAVAD